MTSLLSILLLLLLTTKTTTSTTLSIIPNTSTICALLSSSTPHSIHCTTITNTSNTFTLSPNTTNFSSISSSLSNLCALTSTGTIILCWSSTTNFTPKRLYSGLTPFTSLSLGSPQLSASSSNTIQFWRTLNDPSFPENLPGRFASLTSGNLFTCALSNSTLFCWGPSAPRILSAFPNNTQFSSITAGEDRLCGLAVSGKILCSDNSTAEFPPFELKSLALGLNHTCGIVRGNGTVLCWGRDGRVYSVANATAFELLVANGDLSCGVVSVDFSVVCWSVNSVDRSVVTLPFSSVLPGVCVLNQSLCGCGLFPDSERLCGGSGVICRQCDDEIVPTTLSPLPSVTGSPKRRISKGWLAFGIVGSVGGFAGLCTVAFCVWFGVCHRKKVHNSVQPTITGAGGGNGGAQAVATSGPLGALVLMSPFTSPSGSKSRIFRRQGSRVMRRQRSGPSSFKDRAEEFSFAELAAATKNFAPECKIGEGSFGTVYKGKLPDGREVAIKRSESGLKTKKLQEKERAFQSELAFLSRLHHKHLVGLVGYCEEKEERLLVYDFMKNGALYDHLHSKDDKNSPVFSSWKMRIKVLLDAARGIEYLHNYAVPPIIHRDIKSSNILLDANWVARVSDFGLSLLGPESENGHLSMKAAGTVGYMDPEYYGMQHLTVKSDVYGLGVVMLEVLTGKRAIFKEEEGNPMSVVDYALPQILAGELSKVLDARVAPPAMLEAEALELVAYMAVHCLSLEGRERPSMNDVVSNLEGALALCQESHGSISSASMSLASVD